MGCVEEFGRRDGLGGVISFKYRGKEIVHFLYKFCLPVFVLVLGVIN